MLPARGHTESIQVNVRIICATNKDLEREVEEGTFREDLYYRLNVIQIHMPRLAERREDIPLLSEHFVRKYARELNRKIHRVSDEALQILMNYSYPGNVRELENILERAVALETSSVITPDSLPSDLRNGTRRSFHPAREWSPLQLPEEGVHLESMVEDIERALIRQALERTHGVKKKAANLLHVSFRSFRYRLEKYGMNGRDAA
jgi:two-component system response regulator PilR (NtrC family)